MSIPKYFEMHKAFLKALEDGEQHVLGEVKKYISDYFHLSESDCAIMLQSGRQTVFVNRVGWARTYLKKAGLIDSPSRARFVITEAGKKVLRDDPQVIDSQYLMRYPAFCEFINKNESAEEIDSSQEGDTPDDIFEEAFKKINNSLADEILTEVLKLSPIAFEQMVMDLMQKMGYGAFENAAKTTAASGDEGIDGIIMEDKLGFDLIYVQVKKWNSDNVVSRPEIQGFVGAIAGKGGKGLFVTTSKFSKQARDYADKQHIILIDGEKLANYMIEHNFGVSVKRTFEVKVIDTDLFNDYL